MMTTDLFPFIGMFDKQLAAAQHLLDKGEEKGGAAILGWRLIDDMHPLAFQLRTLIDFAHGWTARVAGLDVPPAPAMDLDLAGWRGALADARAFLATLTPDRLAGRAEAPLTVELGTGMAPTLPAGEWLTGFVTTNLYFHLSIAYAILRHHGVSIGKRDLFAGGL